MAREIGGDDLFAIMRESGAKRQFGGSFESMNFAAIGIPKDDGIVPATGHEPAIVTVADTERAGSMGSPILDLFALLHLPDFDAAVFAGRGEQF